MPLARGTAVGPYHIVEWLAAGGMGAVYRARDPRLGRDVAIKLIADQGDLDPRRVERFAREARAAGQLNHPNVLAVYDVGSHAGAPYIVSELLAGDSLRRVLERGELPLSRAVEFASQAAEGLAAAHEHGVVHRDLKPDNLFITADGRLKILDFGLAKLSQPADDPAASAPAADTDAGTVLGSAGYMSPEQVRGETVDHRSDLFSLGAIAHELITGTPAFVRATAADTIVAILEGEPAGARAARVPPALDRIVGRCLEKPREARFQSARDLAFALRSLSDAGAVTGREAARRDRAGGRWLVAAALFAVAAVATFLALSAPAADRLPPSPLRLSAELGAGLPLAPLSVQFGNAMALSPDGTTMAFVAQGETSASPQLYVRRLDELVAAPLAGTEGASQPFFSPDGEWIGFFSGQLKKVAVTGGRPIPLAEALSARGGTWSDTGAILFTPDQIEGTRLMQVSSEGGQTTAVTTLLAGEAIQAWPQALPGGTAVLYTSTSNRAAYDDANLVVQPLAGGPAKIVQRGGFQGRYVASGHLVYVHGGTLWAVPFDLDRLEVTGPPAPAIEGVGSNALTGGVHVALAANGTLVYLPGPMVGARTRLHWLRSDGQITPLKPAPADWFGVRFAPDGHRFALEVREGSSSDIWIYEWASEVVTRLTLEAADERFPVWSPDGSALVFASNRADTTVTNLYWQRADGSGEAERLTQSPRSQRPISWNGRHRLLAYEEIDPPNVDIMVLPLEGDTATGWRAGTPRPILTSRAIEASPMFSPDGRWLAYTSLESGRAEVYVQAFPGPGGRWLVSASGGNLPTWSAARNELFYGADGQIMVVPFTVEGERFRAGAPRAWSRHGYQSRGANRRFDPHPDGERFVIALADEAPGRARTDTVVFHFDVFEHLRRIAPPLR